MSTTKPPPTKPKAQREKEKDKKERSLPAIAPTERLKAVIRRLPPNLPEDVFWQSVQTWASDENISWRVFYPGKFRKRLNKENIPSRAYIAFKTEEQLAEFNKEYDGHLFRDKAGNESQAVVEFAPYQKIPTEKKKADARNATIEKDEDYISFMDSLTATLANPEPVSLESLIAAAQPPPPPKTTPLLEALKADKSAHKDKESILRNHAHYKDGANILVQGSSKDGNKKGVAPTLPVPKPPANVPKSTRASRRQQQHQQQHQQQQSKVSIPQAHVNLPPGTEGPTASNANGTTVSGPTLPVPPPAKKARPVIGIASRQFEAALTGAGVVGTNGAGAGERKSRREREKAAADATSSSGRTPVPDAAKEKDRGGKRKDEKAGSGSATGNGLGLEAQGAVKVPSILQRVEPMSVATPPAILQRLGSPQPPARPSGGEAGGDGAGDGGVFGRGGGGRRGRGGRRGGRGGMHRGG